MGIANRQLFVVPYFVDFPVIFANIFVYTKWRLKLLCLVSPYMNTCSLLVFPALPLSVFPFLSPHACDGHEKHFTHGSIF